MIYVVSRHTGAVQWLREVIAGPHVLLAHLDDVTQIRAGDCVVGTLPVNLVAKINAVGARYFHLVIEIPESLRGTELTAEQLVQLGANLIEYSVQQHE